MSHEEAGLHPSEHVGGVPPPVNAEAEDVDARGAADDERVPPPFPVLSRELEEDERDGDECGDEKEEDENDGEDAPHVIHGVAPDGVEDVMEFQKDGTEG